MPRSRPTMSPRSSTCRPGIDSSGSSAATSTAKRSTRTSTARPNWPARAAPNGRPASSTCRTTSFSTRRGNGRRPARPA
jgi:hypothetical protein